MRMDFCGNKHMELTFWAGASGEKRECKRTQEKVWAWGLNSTELAGSTDRDLQPSSPASREPQSPAEAAAVFPAPQLPPWKDTLASLTSTCSTCLAWSVLQHTRCCISFHVHLFLPWHSCQEFRLNIWEGGNYILDLNQTFCLCDPGIVSVNLPRPLFYTCHQLLQVKLSKTISLRWQGIRMAKPVSGSSKSCPSEFSLTNVTNPHPVPFPQTNTFSGSCCLNTLFCPV